MHWGHDTRTVGFPRCFSSNHLCRQVLCTHFVVPRHLQGLSHWAVGSSSSVAKHTQHVLLKYFLRPHKSYDINQRKFHKLLQQALDERKSYAIIVLRKLLQLYNKLHYVTLSMKNAPRKLPPPPPSSMNFFLSINFLIINNNLFILYFCIIFFLCAHFWFSGMACLSYIHTWPTMLGIVTWLHAFFYKQRFFQFSLSVAWHSHKLSFKCCLGVA